MFAVIFEVRAREDRQDAYVSIARMLRPELEQVEGFVENIRYRSLTRDGWLLSLSTWRDEKALVRWRTNVRHHEAQEKGRNSIFETYRLRIGQFTRDTRLPAGDMLQEQRLDETETGDATTATFINGTRAAEFVGEAPPDAIASWLGLVSGASGLVAWDVFDAFLTPGDLILLLSWRTDADAEAFEHSASLPLGARLRRVRVIRDYGMFDRREAPQYYPDKWKTDPGGD
jgi:heme-degrading monooxygenase HmoA